MELVLSTFVNVGGLLGPGCGWEECCYFKVLTLLIFTGVDIWEGRVDWVASHPSFGKAKHKK